MKFKSVHVFAIWDGKVLTTSGETFLNVKSFRTQLKGIVSHDELNANYPKMSRFTFRFREKIAMNL